MEISPKPLWDRDLFSTPSLEKEGSFSTVPLHSLFFHRSSTWIPRSLWKNPYRLLLMLVVISFTFSAKAGSVRICFSTLSSECMMVE